MSRSAIWRADSPVATIRSSCRASSAGSYPLTASTSRTPAALAAVLARFAAANTSVDLRLTVGLSNLLYKGFDAGELDVIFSKRRADDPRGQVAWKERLVWVGRPGFAPDPAVPLPLVLYPPPSLIRKLALEALEAAGRPWRVACTSDSLMGLRAAAQAGLGVAPHSARLVPAGLAAVAPAAGLPPMGEIEFVVGDPEPVVFKVGGCLAGNV